jgi:hypothetical protein
MPARRVRVTRSSSHAARTRPLSHNAADAFRAAPPSPTVTAIEEALAQQVMRYRDVMIPSDDAASQRRPQRWFDCWLLDPTL